MASNRSQYLIDTLLLCIDMLQQVNAISLNYIRKQLQILNE
jgi:hypothetical protein